MKSLAPASTIHTLTGSPAWACWSRACCAALPLLLSACATYHARPLPDAPDLAKAIPVLQIDPTKLAVPALAPVSFDPHDGLDMTETVVLAVLNNPDLKAARLQSGVARAQLLQAGLLPDPQLSASFDHPTSGANVTDAYTLGLAEDLRALITRGTAVAGARARTRQVDLQVLWQEWQVAEKARTLFIDAQSQAALHRIYAAARKLDAARYRRDKTALAQGNLTLDAAAGDLVSLVNASTQLRQLERQANQTRHDLEALLGLSPSVALHLSGKPRLDPFSEAQFHAAMRALPQRRPDLLALRAGYASQEAAVRRAILEQFPSLSIGPTRASDTSDVHTIGLSVTLTLPLFNRNRGHIAIERATRAHLRQAYQARLDQATIGAHRIWKETRLLAHQLADVRGRLPALRRTASQAEKSFRAGNLGAATYVSVRSQFLAKRAEAVQLQADLDKAQVNLETVLGMTLGPQAAKGAD